jgi:hypothetical protein
VVRNILDNKQTKDLLIIGCGRSGTKYISSLLRELGVDIGHEKYGVHGISHWYFTPGHHMTKAPWGAPGILFGDYDYKHIFHQIRNPLDAISSITTFTPPSWAWLSQWVPLKKTDTILHKSMKYWYHWNVMAEKNAHWSYRVEDFSIIFEKFFNIIDRSELLNPDSIKVLKSYSTTVNSRPHSKVTWKDLQREDYVLCSRIVESANKYGYKIEL